MTLEGTRVGRGGGGASTRSSVPEGEGGEGDEQWGRGRGGGGPWRDEQTEAGTLTLWPHSLPTGRTHNGLFVKLESRVPHAAPGPGAVLMLSRHLENLSTLSRSISCSLLPIYIYTHTDDCCLFMFDRLVKFASIFTLHIYLWWIFRLRTQYILWLLIKLFVPKWCNYTNLLQTFCIVRRQFRKQNSLQIHLYL